MKFYCIFNLISMKNGKASTILHKYKVYSKDLSRNLSIPYKDVNQLKTDQSRALVNMLVIRRPFELMCSYSFSLPKNGSLDCVLKRNKQFEQVAGTSGDCTLLSLDYLCLILKVRILFFHVKLSEKNS